MANRIPEDLAQKLSRAKEREREKLTAHRGMATWGERLVPLERFREATRRAGQALGETERRDRSSRFTAVRKDETPVEGPYGRIAVFGGVYNNHFALQALLEAARAAKAEAIYCLGDFGGFGPSPEKTRALLDQGGVLAIQGNYEEALASGLEDCNCGYTDPRDNHFAELSYRYTALNTSDSFKSWMGTLPRRRRVLVGENELLLVHGSPRRINEFLFDSTTPDPFLEVMLEQEGAGGFLCTHTGLHWHRRLASGRTVTNVGVIGRPANDGKTNVWFAIVDAGADGQAAVDLRPLEYDDQGLAAEMRAEELPAEFIETIESGWWTTCLEILPARERQTSRY